MIITTCTSLDYFFLRFAVLTLGCCIRFKLRSNLDRQVEYFILYYLIMLVESFIKGTVFNTKGIQTKVILETTFSREIKIALDKGSVMKDHMSPFPVIIYIVDGHIELGVDDRFYLMQTGDIIHVPASIVHKLIARENSIVRLTITKQDSVERVEDVVI